MSTGDPRRCPSKIAHGGGAVLRCMDVPGHEGNHVTVTEQWSDGDDRIIALPVGSTPVSEEPAAPTEPLPELLAAATQYVKRRYSYDPAAYISKAARLAHLAGDAYSTTQDPAFVEPWLAGISEGRRQAAEAIRAQMPATSVIEGGPDLMAWAADLAECRLCPLGVCSAHRPAEGGPWEPAEQPEADRG